MIGAKIWAQRPADKLGKIRGGTAPTGSFPIHEQQIVAGRDASNPGVLDGEIAVNQRSWHPVAKLLDSLPLPFHSITMRNERLKQGRVAVAKNGVFDDFPNRLAGREKQLAIKTGTPIRQTSCGPKLLGRDIHHTKPTPGEDPMFFSI